MKKALQGASLALAFVMAGEASALEWMNNSLGFRYGQ